MTTSLQEDQAGYMTFNYACLGMLSSNIRLVNFARVDSSHFRLRFVLRHENAQDREDIGDIVGDFDAALPMQASFEVDVVVIAEGDIFPPKDSGYLSVYCEKGGMR